MNISSEKTVRSSRSTRAISLVLALLVAGVSGASYLYTKAPARKAPALSHAKIKENVGKLPLAFEPNKGQTDAQVKYLARANSYTAFLTSNETVVRIGAKNQDVLRMKLQNANAAPAISAEDLQVGKSNYLIGDDRSQWHTGIEHYGQVRYENVYPGIDVAYRGNQRDLEYDFVVKPNADPSQIRLAFSGERNMSLDAEGNLTLETAVGKSVNHKPVVYQTINGVKTPVSGEFVQLSKNEVGFKLGRYDRAQPVVIDPVLTVLAFVGGSGDDQGWGVAATNGGVYLTGQTNSVNFPMTPVIPASGTGNPTAVPIYQSTKSSGYDAFVTQMSADGTTLIYSTYLGGNGDDVAKAIAVDSTGAAYIAGYTASTNLPKTVGPAFVAGSGLQAFAAKLSANGQSLGYLTYFGGSSTTLALTMVLDSSNNMYIGGSTFGGLATVNGYYTTYAGGSSDGFIAKMDPNGNYLAASYLGGSLADQVYGLAVDAAGNVYAVGTTSSIAGSTTTFPVGPSANYLIPTTAGTYGFLSVMPTNLNNLTYSLILGNGTNFQSNANAVALSSSAGMVYVGGSASAGFTQAVSGTGSLTTGTAPGGFVLGFKSTLTGTANATGFTATYLGAGTVVNGLAVDSAGQAYYAGQSGGNSALFGRLMSTGALNGAVNTAHGSGTDVLNWVSVNPQREAFFIGSSSSQGTLPAALTFAGPVTEPTSPPFNYGWKNTSTSTPTYSGATANTTGANDVLYMGVQYQDILLSPTSLTFTTAVNGSTPQSQSITASISNGASCTLSVVNSNTTNFTVTQVDSTSVYNVAVVGSTASPIVYTGTLTFSGTGCDNAPVATLTYNVNTTLSVNAGAATTYNVTQGSGISGQGANITIPFYISTSGGSVNYTVALTNVTTPTGGTFPSACIALPPSGTASVAQSTVNATITNTVATPGTGPAGCTNGLAGLSASSLPAGTYTANVAFAVPTGGATTVNIPLTFNVAAQAAGAPGVTPNPTSLAFTFASGSTASTQSSMTLSATNGPSTYSAALVAYPNANANPTQTALSGQGQLPAGALSIVSGQSGTIAQGSTAFLVVQANPTGVPSGDYAMNVAITVGGTTSYYPVYVTVGSGISVTPAGTVTLSAPAGYPAGQNNTAQLTVTVFTNSSSNTVDVPPPTVTLSGAAAGSVTVTPTTHCTETGTTTPVSCTYTLNVNTTNVVAGTYNGTVTFTPTTTPSSASSASPVSVPITLTVTSVPAIMAVTINNSVTTPVPASGFVISQRSTNGSLPSSQACGTIDLETNGGTSTAASTSISNPSNASVYMSIAYQSGAITPPGSTSAAPNQPLTTAPTPLEICANQSSGTVQSGSYTSTLTITDSFGNKTTIPVTVTITSTTAAEIAVFRSIQPGSGGPALFALDVNGNFQYDSGVDKFRQFGLDGDIPVAGDWTGSGTVRIGVYRQGQWFLDLNDNGVWDGTGSGNDGIFSFGLPGDIPVVGDWNGDGRAKFGVFRCPAVGSPGVCTWILDYAGKMAYDPTTAVTLSFGLPGDQPVVNNWNGTGTGDQIGVFRCPSSGVCTWFVNASGSGSYSASDPRYSYGLPGDIPIVGNWNGTGRKRIGVFRNGTTILNVSGSNVFDYSDQIGSFGLAGDKPVIGNWTGLIATNP